MRLRSGGRYIVMMAAICVVYFAAARLGLSLAFATQQVTAVWPPSGIALVALLRFGYRAWPGVFAGAFLINATIDESLATAAGIAAGNTLEAVVGVLLLRRFVGFDGSLDRMRNIIGLIGLAALGSTTVGATVGVTNLCVAGIVPWSDYLSVWRVWWMGDAMGDLVIAPFLLAWSMRSRWPWRGWRLAELGVLVVTLALTSIFVFSGRLGAQTGFQLEYAVFPFLIWSALRFGPRETVSLVLMISAIAIWGSIHDAGPFSAGTLDVRLIALDTFLAITGVTALLLGAAMAERQHAQERLHRARAELEARVNERTAALANMNAELRQLNQALTERTTELAKKNEEVEAFVYVVSHDLRAPLLNVEGFTKELAMSCEGLAGELRGSELSPDLQAAMRPILDQEIPTALHYITASTSKFKRLIDALLALSRSGHQAYHREQVDAQALVATTLDSLRTSIESSCAEVAVSRLPAAIGDPTALGQVFSNLIDNALKYLKPGRPGLIEIGGAEQDDAVHYWVRDNGSGFPVMAKSRAFQVFQRFHPTLAPGEGIGLAIVKRIVEQHGGRVWIESSDGLGAVCHFTLPAAAASREQLDGAGR